MAENSGIELSSLLPPRGHLVQNSMLIYINCAQSPTVEVFSMLHIFVLTSKSRGVIAI